MKTTIKTLYQKGYNKTQIGRMLGIDRKTVRKVLNEGEGPLATGGEKRGRWPSMLDEHKEYIEIQLSKDLSIKRIHQDLQKEFGCECGYSTLRDYAEKIRKTAPRAYMVLHSLPAEEAQVDFGYIGTLNVGGKARKAWVFVMSLSYSRYMYVEITLDQSVKTFIRCHVNAFGFFGGVPETVKIDNLKAAIVEADFYEPTVQRTYATFAKHYGFLPNPCRVYTPTDKGKVESNVKYVKDNCFKGRDFSTVEEAVEFLWEWLVGVANNRVHGTTQKVPAEEFKQVEQGALKPLPEEEFVFSKSASATVRTDCHVTYEGNYYSVSHAYIGMEASLIETNRLLRIYVEGKEVALHGLVLHGKGEHVTDKGHYPPGKGATDEDMLASYRKKMAEVGNGAVEFFERFEATETYRFHHYRSIAGILALRKKHGDEAVDLSCRRACHYGSISYRAVKKICENELYRLSLEEPSGDTIKAVSHSRDLSQYRTLMELGVIDHE